MNVDGTGLTRSRSSRPENKAYYPSWSSDGKRIAFHSDRDGNLEIYTMAADGSDVVRVTNNPDAFDVFAAWRP